jgi:hypothetical protein
MNTYLKLSILLFLSILSITLNAADNTKDLYRTGYDALTNGNDSLALKTFEKIVLLQKRGSVTADSNFATTLKIMSGLYKDNRKSMAALDYAVKLFPKNYDLYLGKAFIYSKMNDKAKTIENLKIVYKNQNYFPKSFHLRLPLEYEQFMQWWNDPEFIEAVQNMLK